MDSLKEQQTKDEKRGGDFLSFKKIFRGGKKKNGSKKRIR